jgi:hypothetical protein
MAVDAGTPDRTVDEPGPEPTPSDEADEGQTSGDGEQEAQPAAESIDTATAPRIVQAFVCTVALALTCSPNCAHRSTSHAELPRMSAPPPREPHRGCHRRRRQPIQPSCCSMLRAASCRAAAIPSVSTSRCR